MFCVNDIHRCVEGAVQTFVFKHPSLPNVWVVMLDTNFTRNEIVSLEKTSFHLSKHSFPPKGLFGVMEFIGDDDQYQEPPFKVGQAPSKHDGKSFQWSELSEFDDYKWESSNLMDVSILHHIDFPPLGIGHVYTIPIFASMLHGNVYDVTMGCYLACSCFDFISMLSLSIGNKEKYVLIKHLYFIFVKRMSCDPKIDIFIH